MSILKWRGQDPQEPLPGLQAFTERPAEAETGTIARPKREKPVWRPVDDLEWRAMKALCNVTFSGVGSGHKRFARNLGLDRITDKQAAYLWALVWRYRRQIRSADLVEHARRLTLPKTDGAFLQ